MTFRVPRKYTFSLASFRLETRMPFRVNQEWCPPKCKVEMKVTYTEMDVQRSI